MAIRSFLIILIIGCFLTAGSILKAISQDQRASPSSNAAALDPTVAPPSTGTAPSIGPYSAYAPIVFDTVSTPTIQPTPTATLEVEPTGTVAPPPTVPPPPGTDTPTPPPGSTATFTPTASATVPPDATPTVLVTTTAPPPP